MSEVTLRIENPSVDEFVQLRAQAGWGRIDPDVAARSIENSLHSVCLRRETTLVGLGRVVGDGALCFYISDLLVSRDHHGQGHGKKIMQAIMEYIVSEASELSTIAVVSMPGKEGFYRGYGFESCPNSVFGKGMVYMRSRTDP